MDFERLLEEDQRERERQAREAYEMQDFGIVLTPTGSEYKEEF